METATINENELDLEEVILEYRPFISSRVRNSLGPFNPDWEDVVNDVILNLVEAIKEEKFRGECSLGSFIYTITSRRIIDYIRKKNKTPKYIPELNQSHDPYEHVERKEQAELISESIKKLKPRYADILYLYYYMGASMSEIAEAFDISPSRVSRVLKDATQSLKKIILN